MANLRKNLFMLVVVLLVLVACAKPAPQPTDVVEETTPVQVVEETLIPPMQTQQVEVEEVVTPTAAPAEPEFAFDDRDYVVRTKWSVTSIESSPYEEFTLGIYASPSLGESATFCKVDDVNGWAYIPTCLISDGLKFTVLANYPEIDQARTPKPGEFLVTVGYGAGEDGFINEFLLAPALFANASMEIMADTIEASPFVTNAPLVIGNPASDGSPVLCNVAASCFAVPAEIRVSLERYSRTGANPLGTATLSDTGKLFVLRSLSNDYDTSKLGYISLEEYRPLTITEESIRQQAFALEFDFTERNLALFSYGGDFAPDTITVNGAVPTYGPYGLTIVVPDAGADFQARYGETIYTVRVKPGDYVRGSHFGYQSTRISEVYPSAICSIMDWARPSWPSPIAVAPEIRHCGFYSADDQSAEAVLARLGFHKAYDGYTNGIVPFVYWGDSFTAVDLEWVEVPRGGVTLWNDAKFVAHTYIADDGTHVPYIKEMGGEEDLIRYSDPGTPVLFVNQNDLQEEILWKEMIILKVELVDGRAVLYRAVLK